MSSLREYLNEIARRVDARMDQLLPPAGMRPERLHEAMRYSLFSGGKRFRPALFLATVQSLGLETEKYLDIACVFEIIHTYSLIHDDLPAFDNDDFRRGKPSNHLVYGESTAILAGDALLTLAFQILAEQHQNLPKTLLLQAIDTISTAAGTVNALIGGQQIDMESQGQRVSRETVEYIHNSKTGALITAAVKSAGIFAGLEDSRLECLTSYGKKLGLVFQITDDILDIVSTKDQLGKTTGKDQKMEKATFPGVFGLSQSQHMASQLTEEAILHIEFLKDEGERLREIARFVLERSC